MLATLRLFYVILRAARQFFGRPENLRLVARQTYLLLQFLSYSNETYIIRFVNKISIDSAIAFFEFVHGSSYIWGRRGEGVKKVKKWEKRAFKKKYGENEKKRWPRR
jgi:hypothetical protein